MEDAKSPEEDDQFLDASDDFPFYDCPSSPSSSSQFFDSHSSRQGLRRRRSLRNQKFTNFEETNGKLDSDNVSSTSEVNIENTDEKNIPLSTSETVFEGVNDENKESSTVTSDRKTVVSTSNDEKNESNTDTSDENDDGYMSLLVYVAEMIVKLIGLQFNLLINIVCFPFWVLYYTCMFAINPLYIVVLGKSYIVGKLMRLWKDTLSPYVSDWLNEHKSWLHLALRCGWGLFWSVYVCAVLVSLLVSAFVIGGLMMRYYVVEEPFELQQGLNFDYTKSKPVALVPIIICPSEECGEKSEVLNGGGFVRVIPPKHKLQASVSMVLPESDYNRNLGIFQVRIDFLSESGRSLASFSHPCMLEFKSQPLRMLLTFFKIIPLVAGYLSETQTLKLKFRGYSEGVIPTACMKITLEQRAEFRAGGGIPEVYDAFVHLESELPFFKRFLWYWRRTIFVWLSMMVFAVELLFALLCCRPVIIPRARGRSNSTRSNAPPTTHTAQS